jgi:putative tricarboxylic transport membrane protein
MFRNRVVSEIIAGSIAVILGVVSIVEAFRLYPMRMSALAGDHSMPAVLGSAMIVLGMLLIFFVKGDNAKVDFPDRQMMRLLIYIIIVMFGYWLLMKYAGYIVSTLIAALLLFRITNSFTWVKSALIAFVTTAVIYVIFVYFLKMVLPEGVL